MWTRRCWPAILRSKGAAGTFKGGYGFHPILAYGDQTGEALAG